MTPEPTPLTVVLSVLSVTNAGQSLCARRSQLEAISVSYDSTPSFTV